MCDAGPAAEGPSTRRDRSGRFGPPGEIRHRSLPRYGADGPTLEIFGYDRLQSSAMPVVNQPGYGHIAFHVDDVRASLDAVLAAGGGRVGDLVTTRIEGVGTLEAVYARDPEGNIIELQTWRP